MKSNRRNPPGSACDGARLPDLDRPTPKDGHVQEPDVLQAYVYDSVAQHRLLTTLLHGQVEEAVRAATDILQQFYDHAVIFNAFAGDNWKQQLADDFVVQIIVALAREQSPGEIRIALGAAAISACKQLVSEPTLGGAYGLLDQARHKVTHPHLRKVANQTTAGIHEYLETLWDEPYAASMEAVEQSQDDRGTASAPSEPATSRSTASSPDGATTSDGIDISEPPDGTEEESDEDHR